ncbi:alpha/beta hydrolase [Kocuria sp. CPCC 205268]|uniref:alpha/beta fold hydrolase n=1 Tax=Kocuria oxytropis TaxID=3058913 RepID=UPI0034D3F746
MPDSDAVSEEPRPPQHDTPSPPKFASWRPRAGRSSHGGSSCPSCPVSAAPATMSSAVPRSGVVEANGTVFFVERRGHGPALLLIHGAGQDAGMLGALAQALAAAGFQVLVYDRRGTGHSGRDAWPGSGAAQHAEDAAALLRLFCLSPAVLVGVDSGGIIAVKLAEQHPECVRHAVVWEPSVAGLAPDGREDTSHLLLPMTAHLAEHPHDFIGAQALLLGAAAGAPVSIDDPDFARVRVNAEAMVLDEPAIAWTTFTDGLRSCPVTVAIGDEPSEPVRAAAAELARLGERPVHRVAGRHDVYLTDPGVLAGLVTEALSGACAAAAHRGVPAPAGAFR